MTRSAARAEISLRPARPEEASRLTEIAVAAKAHWGYPAEWIELWRPSLTFDEELLAREWVRVAPLDGVARGVVALAAAGPRASWPFEVELTHLWVEPAFMGRGLGRALLAAAAAEARRLGASCIVIVSDPHAAPFYERLGARRVGEEPSTPAGRTLPRLELSPWAAELDRGAPAERDVRSDGGLSGGESGDSPRR